ncbi:MAG: aminopeptidase, partial [Faecalibacillus intestinalis]
YIGEFAFGTNPDIEIPRSNILFDEKILGSFHIALGNSHDLSDNGNRASIHWDIVNMMTPEYNGGKILIDDELIQENGIFVPRSLHSLNKVKRLERN